MSYEKLKRRKYSRNLSNTHYYCRLHGGGVNQPIDDPYSQSGRLLLFSSLRPLCPLYVGLSGSQRQGAQVFESDNSSDDYCRRHYMVVILQPRPKKNGQRP